VTLEVTVASRDAEIDGVRVTEGAYIGLVDGTLVAGGPDRDACLLALLERHAHGAEIGTLFYSAAVGQDAAAAMMAAIEERFPDLEVEVHAGGPDLYPYLMALE
jgi:uncharacterized protein